MTRKSTFCGLALLPLALVVLPACVVFPTGLGEATLLTEENLSFIVVGSSTKSQVDRAMTEYLTTKVPDKSRINTVPLKYRDGDWWLYSQSRKEANWGILGAGGGGGVTGKDDFRFALVKFDPDGVVAELEFSSSEGSECNEKGICVGDTYRPQLKAHIRDDRKAKQFTPEKGRCGVYVYGDPFDGNALWRAMPIWLDRRNAGVIVDARQYYYWELTPGLHRIAFSNVRGGSGADRDIMCTPGRTYVFELNAGDHYSWERYRETSVDLQGMPAGHTAIRRRWLVVDAS